MSHQKFRNQWVNDLVSNCIHDVVYKRKMFGRTTNEEVDSELIGKIWNWERAAIEAAKTNYKAYEQAVRALKSSTDDYLLYSGERLGNGV